MKARCGASALLLVGCLSCQAAPLERAPTARESAVSPPAPGDTIDIEFETDAAGNPLPRGTILAEQYAALGVHFHNGYIIGDRTTDFANYVDAPTPDNFICTREGGVAGGCGTVQSRPPTGVPLEITLDFPACFVSIVGRATTSPQLADFSMLAFDGTGYQTAGGAPPRGFSSVVTYDTTTLSWILVHEGVSTGYIPYVMPVGPPFPKQGLDIRKLDIDGMYIGSFDSLQITRCVGLQPKCKDAVVCTSPAQQCIGNSGGSVDNGSYDATGGLPVTVTQSPGPPYALGSTPVNLTVSQGTQTATCSAHVQVGDCNAPTITCPPPATIDCTPNGVNCTDSSAQATAVDSCQTKQISSLASCLRIGPNTLPFTATSASGATSTCSTVITVVDEVPPLITGSGQEKSAVPVLLASADGNFYNASLDQCQVSVSDACDGQLSLSSPEDTQITCVSNDEDPCCVAMSDDVEVMDAGRFVALRAKTNAGGVTRTYTVQFQVTNKSGLQSAGKCFFVVPGLPGQGGAGGGGNGGSSCPSGTGSGGTAGSSSAGGTSGSGGVPGSGGAVSGTGGLPTGGGGNASGGRSGGSSGGTGGGPGPGGSPGSGGTAGAGVSGGAGGFVGAGGSAGSIGTGGSMGVGGATGRGGAAASGGAAGAGATGGRAIASGGASGSHGGLDGGADAGHPPPEHSGCSAVGGAPPDAGWFALALGALLALRGGRRRGTGCPPTPG